MSLLPERILPPRRQYAALSYIPDVDDRIIDALSQGQSIYSLADEWNIARLSIQRRAWANPDYADAMATCVQARMEQREAELQRADNNVAVTRADRLLGHARWLAERSCPDRWGAKPTGTGTVNVQIVINKPGDVQVAVSSDPHCAATTADSSVVR